MSASPSPPASPTLDPDRYLDLKAPGSQEWWYFDALSDDGNDVLVVILFAGLPFDPAYGVAARRHLKGPGPAPGPRPARPLRRRRPWYRLAGATIRRHGRGNPGPAAQAFGLNAHRRDAFAARGRALPRRRRLQRRPTRRRRLSPDHRRA